MMAQQAFNETKRKRGDTPANERGGSAEFVRSTEQHSAQMSSWRGSNCAEITAARKQLDHLHHFTTTAKKEGRHDGFNRMRCSSPYPAAASLSVERN